MRNQQTKIGSPDREPIPSSARGAAITEFLVVMLALVPLVMGSIQAALVFHAKTILSYATFEAARAGAVQNAQRSAMKRAFQRNVLSLYGGGSTAGTLAQSLARSSADLWTVPIPGTSLGAGTSIDILSPTQEAFKDYGIRVNGAGTRFIPNEHLRYRSRAIGVSSKVDIQDANLLKIKITYHYKLIVPVINRMVAVILRLVDPGNIIYYNADPPRLTIVSYATVRMQSDAQADTNMSITKPAP
jgi:hypothetical protein